MTEATAVIPRSRFAIDLPVGRRKFKNLDLDTLRDFREYSIPTIEITLKDTTEVDEVIDLFVDINQRGVEVKRFDIVKAMHSGFPSFLPLRPIRSS